MPLRFDDIGNRLKAFRLGSGLSADEIANRLGISRTALYRFEKGELAKIETLEKLAELLNVSIPTLLGVGVEYVPSAVSYFERMRALDQVGEVMNVLRQRKETYRRRQPGIVNLIAASEMERFLGNGLVGRLDLPARTRAARRALARAEAEHFASLMAD